MLNNLEYSARGLWLTGWIVGIKALPVWVSACVRMTPHGLDGLSCMLSLKWPSRRGWCRWWAQQKTMSVYHCPDELSAFLASLDSKYAILPNLILFIISPKTWPIPYQPKPTYHVQSSLRIRTLRLVEDTPEIPHSETAQHVDNCLNAVQAILLEPTHT